MNSVLVTPHGLTLLRERLSNFEQAAKQISKEVGEAAGSSHDWHDNFEYEDAQRRLAQAYASIQALRETINNAQIVEPTRTCKTVGIGNLVHFYLGEQERTLTIAGHGESAPENDIVAYDTPLGAALLGKEVNEVFDVTIAGKRQEIEIVSIGFPDHSKQV